MTDKPSLLYVSPVVPLSSGNGLAMRAGTVLRILTEWYRIRLLVFPLYVPGAVPVPAELEGLCEGTAVVPIAELPQGGGGAWADRAPGLPPSETEPAGGEGGLFGRLRRRSGPANETQLPFSDLSFDVVHIFRLVTVRLANPYLMPSTHGSPARARRHLDLDDIESRTMQRVAALYRENGQLAMAARTEAEAGGALAWENAVLPQVDRVCVCSETDRREILTRLSTPNQPAKLPPAQTGVPPGAGPEVCVLPNAVAVPDVGPPAWKPVGASHASMPFVFLFVGTLGYYPNQDALWYFCNRVWPLIRRDARVEVELIAVGAGMFAGRTALSRVPCVQVLGEVPEVETMYRRAHAVIVPVRAGGGTRIKVLEAFGYRRPVVSTSVGIEGIEAMNEEHVLLGDTPEDFARQCLRLTDDSALRERLTQNAFSLFTRAYTLEAVARSAASCLGPRPGSGG
jgi:glycosyltransferase involved in cell wall biosynthesis